ncbi:MAG: putative bifunctional diguanylate cyclase/phosphodiesterase [Gammaproteobacteria bacterium]
MDVPGVRSLGLSTGALRSPLARRLFALFGLAALAPALLLGVISFREVHTETESLNRRNRFEFTKSAAMYLRWWLDKRALDMSHWAGRQSDRRGDEQSGQYPDGRIFVVEDIRALALSADERATLRAGGRLVRTQALGPDRARITLFQRIEIRHTPVLVAYALGVPPPLSAVLPAEYAFCILNERMEYVACSAPPPRDWQSAVRGVTRRGGFMEARVQTPAGPLALTTWNLFMDEGYGVGDWRVMTWQSDDFVPYSATDFMRSQFVVIGLGAGGALLLTVFALRRSLEPLQRLTGFAQALTGGRFDARIDLHTGDELEQVGQAFNTMAARLAGHIRRLERHSDLEQTILANADTREIVNIILDYLRETSAGAPRAVALRLDDTAALGLCSGDAPVEFPPFEKLDGIFDGTREGALVTLGAWAGVFAHAGDLRTLVRSPRPSTAIALVLTGDTATAEDEERQLQDLLDRVALALDNRATQRKLLYRSFHHPLTNLPNRESLIAALPAALMQAAHASQGVALLLVDVDDFRSVNDTFGYEGGDAVLNELAQRLRNLARAGQRVMHVRTDVFALLVADLPLGADEALATLRTLIQAVQLELTRPIERMTDSVRLSMSFGGAMFPRDAATGEELLSRAEQAVERAKQEVIHRRVHFYGEELTKRTARSLSLRNELERAIEDRAFVVHYQPKIAIATGRVVGAEALVRWQHPQQGLVMPGGFIVEAEQSGLILEIGQIVMEQACAQLQDWRMRFDLEDFKLSVNLAARQFEAPDLDARVLRCLSRAQLPAHALELEVTETVACADMRRTIQFLERLRAIGVSLSLDDFGTGHSSLRYLQQMPIDVLKVDRSFVMGIGAGAKAEAVIDAVLALCRRLGLVSVAEGVETQAQADYLREHGCDVIQGYLYGKPCPPSEFERFVRPVSERESTSPVRARRA